MPELPGRGDSAAVVYLTVDGVRYRVLDARMHQGKMAVANPPAAWATFRVFRPEEGQRRLYYFKPGESRAPEPVLLEQQLQRAEYLPKKAPENRDFDPR
jgi:hypothetical protein